MVIYAPFDVIFDGCGVNCVGGVEDYQWSVCDQLSFSL